MKPWHRIAVFFCILGLAMAFAIPRWLDAEPEVYEAALSGLYSYDVAVASSPSVCGIQESAFDGISSELLSAFRIANSPGAPLGNVSGLSSHFAVANSTQLAALESQGLGPSTAGSPPLQVVRLSRVGFDAHKSEALLCIRASGGSLLLHLRKLNGLWQIVHNEPLQVAWELPHNYSLKRTAAGRLR